MRVKDVVFMQKTDINIEWCSNRLPIQILKIEVVNINVRKFKMYVVETFMQPNIGSTLENLSYTTGKKVFANCLTFNFYDPEFFKEEKSYVFPRNTPKSV